MSEDPGEVVEQGCIILDGVLSKFGFNHGDIVRGKSSGGDYATTTYLNGERKLQIHFRYSLGLVTYHFGAFSLLHEDYMKALLGTRGGNQYPCYSDEPLDAFRGLASDLETYASAFLTGDSASFGEFVKSAKMHAGKSGFARLLESEG